MSVKLDGSTLKRLFLLTIGLTMASLLLPGGLPGPAAKAYLVMQACLCGAALVMAVAMAYGQQRDTGSLLPDHSLHAAACTAAGVLVGALFGVLPLTPLVFFVGFPLTVFARRIRLFWFPAAVLASAALGRYLFFKEGALLIWTAAFLLYSCLLGYQMNRDSRRIAHLHSQLSRINSDAREMMGRLREDTFSKPSDRIRSEDAARAIALDEDDFLQRLLRWGCRVFNARTGILLVPGQPGFFRMRAAVHRGVEIREGLVPADRGFIHITKERDGVLCISDARSAIKTLSFYPEDTKVGSFLVKIVVDPRWGRDAGEEGAGEKIRCVLYFDTEKADSLVLDEITAKRLDEFGELVSRAMETTGHLQKLTTEISSRDAISRYARSLTQSLDSEYITEMALKAVMDAVPKCDGAVVMLYDKGLSVVASRGDLLERLGSERILRDETSQVGLLLRRFAELESGEGVGDAQGAEIVITHRQAKKHPFFRKGEQLGDIISFAAIPCYMGEGRTSLKAAIAVVSSKENAFGKEELEELRTIAGMTAPALDNAVQHRQVDELSRTDGLTGLLNHRIFQIVLDGKLNNLMRGYFKSLAVIMVDADHFKKINDSFGHPVGDEVLVELARRLKTGVRKNDAVARYGGEEFAVILDNAGEKEAQDIAEKMRHSIRSRPFATSAGRITVTASFGYTIAAGRVRTAGKELLERADQALYQAKERGRDRVVSYSEMEASAMNAVPSAVDSGKSF